LRSCDGQSVSITKVETLDEEIELAVRADSHKGLARSNDDKQHAVQCLLRTEQAHKITNKEIGLAAGVVEETVRRYRERREPTHIVGSLSEIRVNKRGERRPTKYKRKKRKKKQPPKPPSILETYQPVNWPTREQTGGPPMELANEPHPDHPGKTYAQVFVEEHGFVQLVPLDEKRRPPGAFSGSGATHPESHARASQLLPKTR
jgi:hypothetical protein